LQIGALVEDGLEGGYRQTGIRNLVTVLGRRAWQAGGGYLDALDAEAGEQFQGGGGLVGRPG
jgi:hypothetical protein